MGMYSITSFSDNWYRPLVTVQHCQEKQMEAETTLLVFKPEALNLAGWLTSSFLSGGVTSYLTSTLGSSQVANDVQHHVRDAPQPRDVLRCKLRLSVPSRHRNRNCGIEVYSLQAPEEGRGSSCIHERKARKSCGHHIGL